MEISGVHASAGNLCVACIDDARGAEISGRLFCYYKAGAIPFSSHAQLIGHINALCDWLGYPQATEQMRSFLPPQRPAAPPHSQVPRVPLSYLTDQHGRLATFSIHVMFRQNATWQGSVAWLERQSNVHFRSVLELTNLIDGAVDDTLGRQPPFAPKEPLAQPKRVATKARRQLT